MTRGGRRRLGLLLAGTALAALTGCAAPTVVHEAATTRAATPTSWFLDSSGVVPPTATAPTTIGLAPVIPRPGTFEVPRPVPYGVIPHTQASPAPCGSYSVPKTINPGATPGTGSATVYWQADDRAEVTGYRVQAVPQTIVPGVQPEPVKLTVDQPGGCVQVSTTVTGLTSGETYIFWLEEAVVDSISGATRLIQVGTSSPVPIS
jgi:hypothetical protein